MEHLGAGATHADGSGKTNPLTGYRGNPGAAAASNQAV